MTEKIVGLIKVSDQDLPTHTIHGRGCFFLDLGESRTPHIAAEPADVGE